MEISKIIGENLQVIVNEQFSSNAELARFLGLSGQTISNYLNGKNSPAIETLLKLEVLLNLPIRIFATHFIYYNKEKKKYEPGLRQLFLETPKFVEEPEEPISYNENSKMAELREKIDLLWRTNLHRAEKMEQTEVKIREIEREIDLLRKELADLKKAGK